MDTTSTRRRALAVLVAASFGVAAPLTATSLAHAAVQGHGSSHSRDSDGDKMPNRWENKHRLDAHKANARRDADHDGLKNLAEFRDGTDPQDADSDDDGVEDGDDLADCADDAADDSADDSSDDSSDDSDDADEADDCDHGGSDDTDDDSSDDAPPVSSRAGTYVIG